MEGKWELVLVHGVTMDGGKVTGPVSEENWMLKSPSWS